MQHFGQFKQVLIREAWKHEQYDFTPWLAQEDNIAQLAEAIGTELEVEDTEVAVGPYSADILAKSLMDNRYVVIENQFGKTNHDHLGKLITYASFLDAGIVVWLAEHFTEEHMRALDWLNDHTSDDLGFYGVILELWQIDDSKPAVRFDVISRPNVIVRQARQAKENADLTETEQIRLEFWTAFRDRLLESKILASTQTPSKRHWFDVPLGRSNVFLSLVIDVKEGDLGIRVLIRAAIVDEVIDGILEQKDHIEKEIGYSLDWDARPESSYRTIALHREVDFYNRATWPEATGWLVQRVDDFRKAFSPLVKRKK